MALPKALSKTLSKTLPKTLPEVLPETLPEVLTKRPRLTGLTLLEECNLSILGLISLIVFSCVLFLLELLGLLLAPVFHRALKTREQGIIFNVKTKALAYFDCAIPHSA